MLSYDENRQLKAIEQWFEESDPRLTRMLRDHEAPERGRQRRAVQIAVDLTGGLLVVLGAVAATLVLVVFGMLVLAAGACLHLAARR
jgi:predicted metal-dependent hydrolase